MEYVHQPEESDGEPQFTLVYAPNKAGENFVKLLKYKGIPYAVLTNNEEARSYWIGLGVQHVICIDSADHQTWIVPDVAVGNVYIFEQSLNLCCRFIQICRSWTSKSIYVITQGTNPRMIYRGLGADCVVHSRTGDVAFLLQSSENG